MFHRGWFHVAVEDAWLREQVCNIVASYGTARVTTGDRIIDHARYAGAIAEWGPGFDDWLRTLRAASPTLPALVFIPAQQLFRMNELHARSVEVALQPLHIGQLMAFVQRSLAHSCLPHDGVARMVAHVASARGLTSREVQLLSFCLADEPRARIRRRLGISENTLKTQVKALLRKCNERNVDALAKNVLRAALLERLPASAAAFTEPVAPWFPAQGAA